MEAALSALRRLRAQATDSSSRALTPGPAAICTGGPDGVHNHKKGQATIPKAIREHLHLKPEDRAKFFAHPDGSVVLLPALTVTALRGMLKHYRRSPATVAEMDEAVIAGANEGVVRLPTAMIGGRAKARSDLTT